MSTQFDQFEAHEQLAAAHYKHLIRYLVRQKRYLQRIAETVAGQAGAADDEQIPSDESAEQ